MNQALYAHMNNKRKKNCSLMCNLPPQLHSHDNKFLNCIFVAMAGVGHTVKDMKMHE
jgi:hypothetical protein